MTPQGRGLGKGQRTTECPLLGVSSRINLRGLSGLLLALAAADLGLPPSQDFSWSIFSDSGSPKFVLKLIKLHLSA